MSLSDVKMEEDQEEMTVQTEDDPLYVVTEEEIIPEILWTDLLFDYWFLWLILVLGAIYFYHKCVAPEIERWMREREDRDMEARLHKNPDLLRAREEAMQRARLKMQEQHDIEAARKAEERQAREEKKREEMLAKNATKYRQVGYTLNETVDNGREGSTLPRPSRSDYNPLMGSGSGGGYRPPRRSCPGGGCG